MYFYLIAILSLVVTPYVQAENTQNQEQLKKEIEAKVAPLIPVLNQKLGALLSKQIEQIILYIKKELPLKNELGTLDYGFEIASFEDLLAKTSLANTVLPGLANQPFSAEEKKEILTNVSTQALFEFKEKAVDLIPSYQEMQNAVIEFVPSTPAREKTQHGCVLELENGLKNSKPINTIINEYYRCKQKNMIATMALSTMQDKLDEQRK